MPFTYTPGVGGGWVVGTAEPTVPPFGEWTYTIQPVGGWELEDMTQPATFNGGFASIGPQGPAGAAGASATVAIGTTTTGAAGSPATVTNSGTSSAAVFNFTIPQGIQGIQGIKGDTGDSGVVYATSPLAYNALTKTVSIDLSSYATQSWVGSQGYITTSALSGYATESWVGSQGYLTSASLSGYATQAWVGSQGYLTSSSLTGYATQSWVNSQGFLTSSALTGYATEAWVGSQGYITSSALSGYATQSWVTSQGYLTTAPVTSVAGKTGAVTLASTDITDFSTAVPAAVPAASTSTAGKVQLATEAQAQAKTSTTTAISPDALLNSHVGWVSAIASPGTAVSTGVVTSQAFGSRCSLTATAANQYAIAYTATGSINTFTTTGTSYSDCNFSKRIKIYGRCYIAPVANLNAYYAFGRSNNTLTTIGSPASKGFGIRIQGTGAVELQVHNGTTLANVTSSFTPTTSQTFDVLIDSLGNGTVNLYINGSLVATSNAGATGTGGAAFPTLIQEFSSTAASGAGAAWFVEGKAMYFA